MAILPSAFATDDSEHLVHNRKLCPTPERRKQTLRADLSWCVRALLSSLFILERTCVVGICLSIKNQIIKNSHREGVIFTSFLIFATELFLLKYHDSVYTHNIAQIFLGTTPREATEFIQSFFSISILFPLALGIGIITAGAIYYDRWARGRNIRLVSWINWLLLPRIAIVLMYALPLTYYRIRRSNQADNLFIAPYDRLLWNTYGVIKEARSTNAMASKIGSIDLGTLERDEYTSLPTQDSLNIVIIVGETLRKDYMSCYGYSLTTTPGLDSILNTGDIIAYTDVVSPAINTVASLTKVLTYQTNDTDDNWLDYPALSKVLSQAGYWVDWVSNQENSGAFIEPLGTIAKLSDSYEHVNTRDIEAEDDVSKNYYDEDVLPSLKDYTYRSYDPSTRLS